jgi:hypothetical protein
MGARSASKSKSVTVAIGQSFLAEVGVAPKTHGEVYHAPLAAQTLPPRALPDGMTGLSGKSARGCGGIRKNLNFH